MHGQQPLMNGDVRALHNRAYSGSELVAAVIAQEVASLRFAGHTVDVGRAAERAERAIWPARRFKVRNRLGFIVKDRIGKVSSHDTENFRLLGE